MLKREKPFSFRGLRGASPPDPPPEALPLDSAGGFVPKLPL